MNYTITPSTDPPQSDVSLRVATATFDVEGRNFLITTPWNTIFRHKLVIHSAFPGGPIDAYIEQPADDNVNGKQDGGEGEDEVKLVPKSVGMIYVKQSKVVPVGAKLVRVWGSEELWMLYFPPKPLAAVKDRQAKEMKSGGKAKDERAAGKAKEAKSAGKAKETKSAGKAKETKSAGKAKETKSAGKAEATTRDERGKEDKKEPSGHARSLGDFGRILAEIEAFGHRPSQPEGFASWASFDDECFAAYARDLGHGVTAEDVRIHFANQVADANHRRLNPEHNDDFWESFWQMVTRGGTLEGTTSSYWRKGHDLAQPPERSKVDEALNSQGRTRANREEVSAMLSNGVGPLTGAEVRRETAQAICDEKHRRRHPEISDLEWEALWQMATGGKTMDGLPRHWKDKA